MKKGLVILTIAASIALGGSVPALAHTPDCHVDVMSIHSSLERVNPSGKKEDTSKEGKLTKEQNEKKDSLMKELKSNGELVKAKQQEVATLRQEIKQKLDSLSSSGKTLSQDQYNSIKESLNKIASIQQEIDKERMELAKKHQGAKEKDFDAMIKELEEINSLEKKRIEKLDEVVKELQAVKKIIEG